jgi:hypothetical protein
LLAEIGVERPNPHVISRFESPHSATISALVQPAAIRNRVVELRPGRDPDENGVLVVETA